ncbi:peroxidase family protein [uncultured Arthrobacter sp.]|uniref:peroxidase family protein n=1 Tax=uncultured Arthrobacter sp. TaxID=114050 RepID=UPI00260A8A61|nr:peroxidase family protein [uncultured Arthrobacter sp.]
MSNKARRRSAGRRTSEKLTALAVGSAVVLSGIVLPGQVALAAPPPGQDFNVTTGDLEFILKQIKISEAHAEDVVTVDQNSSPLCNPGNVFNAEEQTHYDADGDPCVGNVLSPFGLRTVDGRWNNLMPNQDGWGSGSQTFPRLLDPEFKDAEPIPAGAPGGPPGTPTSYEQTEGFVYDSSPRNISNLIVDQTTNNPAAVAVAERVEGAGVVPVTVANRLEGQNRFGTAAAVSADTFGPNVPVVYIATGATYPDALTGGPAAKAGNGPVLLVSPNAIPAETVAELQRLAPQRIVVLGGPIAVSTGVETALGEYTAGTVTRLAGDNRYGTAAAISADTFAPGVGKVYIATGQDFPDALVAAAPAARDGHPVLLTLSGSIPAPTIAELQRLAPQEIVVVGTTARVSDAVVTQLGEYTAGAVTRVDGVDRYETAVALSQANYAPGVTHAFIARGTDFPDALAGSYLAGLRGGPLLLVPDVGAMPASVSAELQRLAPQSVTVLGGPIAVPAETEAAVAELLPGSQLFIPDIATDEGLSASATSLFTIFGQFFDHGLDLISKGGNGTVVVPLRPDDPLYVEGSQTNFFMLDRATIDTGENGDERNHTNRTTPFVDQNQTYTSHPSHQVFLREYEAAAGGPVSTGRLLNGDDGEGLATWADTKEQARTLLGIELRDMDVLNVPLLKTDPYGKFVPGPNGYPQLATPDGFVEGNPDAPISTVNAERTNNAFLDDIARGAVPNELAGYDNAALDAHFVTGDGRGNENIALSAVHQVFHSEHNRVMEQVDAFLNEPAQADLLAKYQAAGFWDYGERLFQAARFFTEMQYQHLVFEEFARRIQPTIDPGVFNEVFYMPDVNPAISSEFANVVYRFGHSMLTDTVDRDFGGGVVEKQPLLDAFLNPVGYNQGPNGEQLSSKAAAGAVLKGMANQTAAGIDEFVADTLRNQLLGLPLDLASINMLRARETGVPGLQAARAQFFDQTQMPQLAPYTSWEDFRLGMKNPESIVNFVAAYGIHPSLQAATTMEQQRAAATTLIADTTFMNAAAADTGVNNIDFWMGGLAEKPFVFGGMMGSTFNFVFENQLESLQNGDRFYYLNRNLGNTLFHSLEANSFSQIIERNTEMENLQHDPFAAPQLTFDLDNQTEALAGGMTFLNGQWRFAGADHTSIHGTDGNDNIRAGIGDDSVWGGLGNDRVEGDDGVDALMGGDGDDILTDSNGDDRIQGEAGNDAINGGPGIDLLFGGSGKDVIYGGQDHATTFAGLGDDFLYGSSGADILIGNEGNDWIEGAEGGADLLVGDNSNTMENDPNLSHGGHDILNGGPGNTDFDSEGGDDIMVAGASAERFAGMLGFDWVTHKDYPFPVNVDMAINALLPDTVSQISDRFLATEATSGWRNNDVIRGSAAEDDIADPTTRTLGYGHRLTQAQLDRVEGLRNLLGGGAVPEYARPFLSEVESTEEDFNNNILLGGQGSDLVEPRVGRNFVDGDAWLDVNVVWRPNGGEVAERAASMRTFQTRVFSGAINPADLHAERRIMNADTNQADATDTVLYAESRAEFTIEELPDGAIRVTNILEPTLRTDVLKNVEILQFSDTSVDVSNGVAAPIALSADTVTLEGDAAAVGDTVTTTTAIDPAAEGVTFELQAIAEDQDGNTVAVTTQDNTTGEFVITEAEEGSQLQVVATFTDGDGVPVQVTSEATETEVAAAP